MARNIGAVVAGLLVVGFVVAGLQLVSAALFPPPEGLDPWNPDPELLAEFVANLPASAWLLVFGSELLGAFLGGLTAGRIARSRHAAFAGGIVGLAVVGSIINWVSFSHPTWFIVGQLIAYPIVFLAVSRLLPDSDE